MPATPNAVQFKQSLHNGQRELLNSDARFRIAVCGRRWGKTEVAVIALITHGLEHPGARIWWVGSASWGTSRAG